MHSQHGGKQGKKGRVTRYCRCRALGSGGGGGLTGRLAGDLQTSKVIKGFGSFVRRYIKILRPLAFPGLGLYGNGVWNGKGGRYQRTAFDAFALGSGKGCLVVLMITIPRGMFEQKGSFYKTVKATGGHLQP